MTSAQAITKFKTLYDQYGSPWITDAKIISFLNSAQYEFLNRLFPDSLGGLVNVELDENTLTLIAPLILPIGGVSTSSSGLVTYGNINVVVEDEMPNSVLFRILNVSVGQVPVKYTRHNNINALFQNFFKTPTSIKPRYTIDKNGIQLYPKQQYSVNFTIVRTPQEITTLNTPDWDDYTMNNIIFQALKLAGVSVSDEKLIADIRSTGVQSAQ